MQIRKETGMFPWLTSFPDITVQDSDESSSGQRCPGQDKLNAKMILQL